MNLLFATDDYPGFPGEEFIEDELPILSEVFSSIYIIRLTPKDDPEKVFRSTPPNVHVLFFDESKKFLNGMRCLLLHPGKLLFESVKMTIHEQGKIRSFYQNLKSCFKATRRSYEIQKFIEAKHINIVYSYWASKNALALVSAPDVKNGRVPFVCRAHGYDLFSERQSKCRLSWYPSLLQTVHKLFPCSDYGQGYLIDRYPQYANKIETRRLGVSEQHVMSSIQSNGQARPLRLVSCSYMTPVKRLDLLANALTLVKRDVIWTHIGDGPTMPSVLSVTKALPSNVKVVFTGHYLRSQVADLYLTKPQAILINVSDSEGLPVSMMEAMSFGIPVVARNVGGVAEIVTAATGILLDQSISEMQIAAVIEGLDPDRFDRCEIATYQRLNYALSNYERFANELREIGGVNAAR